MKNKKFKITIPLTLLSTLTIIFVASKVFQVGICKDWSWWWALSPMWLPWAVFLGIIFGILALKNILLLFAHAITTKHPVSIILSVGIVLALLGLLSKC